MKTIFLAPRETVDMLAGRCHHHAVQTETGDWLVVAEIPNDELRAAVLQAAGTLELPHPNSGAAPPTKAVDALGDVAKGGVVLDGPATAASPETTRDLVQGAIERLGMPVLLPFLDR
jgi:hypothetical protein